MSHSSTIFSLGVLDQDMVFVYLIIFTGFSSKNIFHLALNSNRLLPKTEAKKDKHPAFPNHQQNRNYPKPEKVLKDNMITAGLVKDKQSGRAEIIYNYIPLKVVLGQVRHINIHSMKADATCQRLCQSGKHSKNMEKIVWPF